MIRHEVKRLFTGKHRRHKPTRERTIPDNDGNANLQNIRSSTLRYLQPESRPDLPRFGKKVWWQSMLSVLVWRRLPSALPARRQSPSCSSYLCCRSNLRGTFVFVLWLGELSSKNNNERLLSQLSEDREARNQSMRSHL
jgi:hypothetical protein